MRKTKWLALFGILALLLSACGGDDGEAATTTTTTDAADDGGTATTIAPAPGPEAGRDGDLLLLQWQAPSQANPLLSSGTKDLMAGSLVLEPLAAISPEAEVVPVLASEVPTVDNGGVAADFTSITWTLREGIVWSDGTALTSGDILFTYEYCSDELTGCAADFSTIGSIEAVDDLTVTIDFITPEPFPYVDFVTFGEPIIQRAQFQDCVGERAKTCTEENFAPIGTGPFMVTDLKPEDTVTYSMNPNYRAIPEGKPAFANLTIKGGGDAEATARSVLEIGEADYAWNLQVPPEILLPMQDAGHGVIVSGFSSMVETIHLNQTDPDTGSEWAEGGSGNHPILYQNSELAKALSLAIDREALVAVGYGPTGTPTCTVWPVGEQASPNLNWCLTRDVAQANRILDDLGYLDSDGDGIREAEGYGPLSFTFATSTNAVRQSNQAIIKENWLEIGVDAQMQNVDAGLFFDGTSASGVSIWQFPSDMQMFTDGWIPDPVGYLYFSTTAEIPTAALGWPASHNLARMSIPEYDSTWATLSITAPYDPAYLDLVHKLQDLMVESGAVIPLIHRGNVSGFSNRLEGFGDSNGWDSEYWNIADWSRAG